MPRPRLRPKPRLGGSQTEAWEWLQVGRKSEQRKPQWGRKYHQEMMRWEQREPPQPGAQKELLVPQNPGAQPLMQILPLPLQWFRPTAQENPLPPLR